MKKTTLVALLGAFALTACSTSDRDHHSRWSPNGTPRDENWHSPNAALLRYDTDHDGTLTRAELVAGLKAEYSAYDVNHKNCLGPDQVRAINQTRLAQDASQASPLVDWNQDTCIDFNEYSAAALSLFDTLDTNSDGQLSPQELNAGGGHPAGGGQGGGQGGGGRGGHGHGRDGRHGGSTPGGQ